MKLTIIVRGFLYEQKIPNDDETTVQNMLSSVIHSRHSAFGKAHNGHNGVIISANDNESIVGHYIVTKG